MKSMHNDAFDVKSIKILAVGNSFSVNAMRYLYDILKAGGAENVILGDLYIGGCSLETHENNAKNDNPHYTFYRNDSGTWEKTPGSVLGDILRSEDWDIITFQQSSGISGIPSTYEPFLGNLLGYVNQNRTNPSVKYAWHMTWAYQKGADNPKFPNYGSDQLKMYASVTDTIRSTVLAHNEFSLLLPSGTAIQNARTSYMGDCFNSDGSHLNPLGEYLAGLAWYVSLTGKRIESLPFVPDEVSVSESDKKVLMEAANNTLDNMLSITPSVFFLKS